MCRWILLCCLITSLLFMTMPCLSQETISPLGIFDATADWSLDPDFKPEMDNHKFPNHVKIQTTDEGLAYDLSGYGHFYWNYDNGLFLYKELSGSWTITCKVQWLDIGDRTEFESNAGIMIRENGSRNRSKFYAICLMSGTEKNSKKNGGVLWRSQDGDTTLFGDALPSDTLISIKPGESAFFRLTRIAPENFVFAEWSVDSKQWQSVRSLFLELGDNVAMGLFRSGPASAQDSGCVRFTQVSFHPASPMARRWFPGETYSPGEAVEVILHVNNPSDLTRDATVTEKLPLGWNPRQISDGGRSRLNEITWQLTLKPGIKEIHYKVIPNFNISWSGNFSGMIDSSPIQGRNFFIPSSSPYNQTLFQVAIFFFQNRCFDYTVYFTCISFYILSKSKAKFNFIDLFTDLDFYHFR